MPSDGKSSRRLWQGELKKKVLLEDAKSMIITHIYDHNRFKAIWIFCSQSLSNNMAFKSVPDFVCYLVMFITKIYALHTKLDFYVYTKLDFYVYTKLDIYVLYYIRYLRLY